MDLRLKEYVDKKLNQGLTKEQIKNNLLNVGWSEDIVEENLNLNTKKIKNKSEVRQEIKNEINKEVSNNKPKLLKNKLNRKRNSNLVKYSIIFLAIVFLGLIIYFVITNNTFNEKIIDCNDNLVCMQNALNNNKEAKFIRETTLNVGGVENKIYVLIELLKIEENLELKFTTQNIVNGNTDDEMILEKINIINQLKEKSGYCSLSKEKVSEIFSSWLEGNYMLNFYNKCSGEYFHNEFTH